LTGLVVCGGCGSRFTGTAATGRNATYRYYTCGGRQRYGTRTCSADRLPAGALDDAVVHSLLAAYDRVALFTDAVAEAQQRAALGHDRHQGELHALDAELAKVEAGIDRYLRAFETGAMPEALCGERVKALGAQATALRARREQLADEMEDADLTAPTPEELSVLRERVAEAVAQGSSGPVKALLQALIHEIRVDSRGVIHPTFRVPLGGDHQLDGAVRAPSRSVGRRGLEPLTPCASCKCAASCANGPEVPHLSPRPEARALLPPVVHRGPIGRRPAVRRRAAGPRARPPCRRQAVEWPPDARARRLLRSPSPKPVRPSRPVPARAPSAGGLPPGGRSRRTGSAASSGS